MLFFKSQNIREHLLENVKKKKKASQKKMLNFQWPLIKGATVSEF